MCLWRTNWQCNKIIFDNGCFLLYINFSINAPYLFIREGNIVPFRGRKSTDPGLTVSQKQNKWHDPLNFRQLLPTTISIDLRACRTQGSGNFRDLSLLDLTKLDVISFMSNARTIVNAYTTKFSFSTPPLSTKFEKFWRDRKDAWLQFLFSHLLFYFRGNSNSSILCFRR
jgi:hypothetical protein